MSTIEEEKTPFTHTLFISHRGPEKATVAFPMMAMFGVFCGEQFAFFDQSSILLGWTNGEALSKGIDQSRFCLPIISESFFTSKWCVNEVEEFLNRPQQQSCVIPIFYELSPEVCRDLPEKYLQDKDGTPLEEKEQMRRKDIAKRLGKIAGYSRAGESPKEFILKTTLDIVTKKNLFYAEKAGLLPQFQHQEHLIAQLDYVYEEAMAYFYRQHEKIPGAMYQQFLKLMEQEAQLGPCKQGLRRYYQQQAHHESGMGLGAEAKAQAIDENTFVHLALLEKITKEDKPEREDKKDEDKKEEKRSRVDYDYNRVLPSIDALFGKKTEIPIEELFSDKLKTHLSNPQKAKKPVERYSNILMVGRPGSGKTTLGKKLIQAWSTGEGRIWSTSTKNIFLDLLVTACAVLKKEYRKLSVNYYMKLYFQKP